MSNSIPWLKTTQHHIPIFLWARALPEISGKVWGQIDTYRFLVTFLTVPSPHVCTYVDSTVRCPFTKIVPIVRSGSSKGSHHGISVDSLLVQRICSKRKKKLKKSKKHFKNVIVTRQILILTLTTIMDPVAQEIQ